MLTSVAYNPRRAPAVQQQFVSVCLPQTTFTLCTRNSACGDTVVAASNSLNGCGRRSLAEPVGFLAISISTMFAEGDLHAKLTPDSTQSCERWLTHLEETATSQSSSQAVQRIVRRRSLDYPLKCDKRGRRAPGLRRR